MIPDYLVLGGVEVINSARAAAYGTVVDECAAAIASCFDCPGLADWLTDGEGYAGIAADPAPWWDPASPESERVYGIVGLAVEGLADGAYPQSGNRVDAPSGASRDVMFRVLVEAADECAASYAVAWLRAAIDSACDAGCGGADACMLACCPQFDDAGQPVGGNPARYMFGLLAVEGPEEVERGEGDNRVYVIYEFTLRTSDVDVFAPPPDDQVIEVAPAAGRTVTLDLPAIYDACAPAADCLTDPLNPAPVPPPRPAAPVDPRYPAEPYTAYRTVIDIPSRYVSRGLVTSPVVTITAGRSGAVRDLLVRFYHNPLGVDCGQIGELNPCRACTDVLVHFVPAGGTAVIDSRTDTRRVTCRTATGPSVGDAVAFGPRGGMFTYPQFTCGAPLCAEVYAAAPAPPDARVQIALFRRFQAA